MLGKRRLQTFFDEALPRPVDRGRAPVARLRDLLGSVAPIRHEQDVRPLDAADGCVAASE